HLRTPLPEVPDRLDRAPSRSSHRGSSNRWHELESPLLPVRESGGPAPRVSDSPMNHGSQTSTGKASLKGERSDRGERLVSGYAASVLPIGGQPGAPLDFRYPPRPKLRSASQSRS